MLHENLKSAQLSVAVKTDILTKLADIKDQLDFLSALSKDEIRHLTKPGVTFAPFIDEAHFVVTQHPEVIPPVFAKKEFLQVYQLSHDLTAIQSRIAQLNDAVKVTKLAIDSFIFEGALEVYSAVKTSQAKVPGLNVVVAKMKEFFKKTHRGTPRSKRPVSLNVETPPPATDWSQRDAR